MLAAKQMSGRDNRKGTVMDAAAELFAKHGYHGTSMREVAKASGVTPGAIYAHFTAKHDLLVAIYQAGVRRIEESIEAASRKGGSPWQRLEAICAAHLDGLVGPNPYAKVVVRVLPSDAPDVEQDLVRLRDGYEARFRDAVQALGLDGHLDPTLFRLFLIGALNWTQVWYRPEHAEPAAIARELVALLRSGGQKAQGETADD